MTIVGSQYKFVFIAIAMLAVGFYVGRTWWGNNAANFSVDDISLDKDTYPTVILGSGPGGLTAGLYLAQAQYTPLLLEGPVPGGALVQSHSVRNWPGDENIRGMELMDRMRDHAVESGVQILGASATDVDLSAWPYKVTIKDTLSGDERVIKALTCVIGTGSTPKFLGIPGERGDDGYFGKGVSTCAVCDGGIMTGKITAIVGGGDSSVTEASYLATIAKEVHIFVRGDTFKATGKVKDRVVALSNVKVHFNSEVVKVKGDGKKVTHLVTSNRLTGEEGKLDVDALFLAIGARPNTSMLSNLIQLDSLGYIMLKHDQETSVPGVFAVGDVSDPIYKQAVSSSGEGCRAALQALEFLNTVGFDSNYASRHSDVLAGKVDPKKDKPAKKKADSKPEKVKKVEHGSSVEVSDSAEFKAYLAKDNTPVVVDFYATWCTPCKMMNPVYKKVAERFDGKVKFFKVNIDNIQDLPQEYFVQGVPTFLFLDSKGNEIDREVGAMSEDTLATKVDALL